ncbi:MAG: YbjN domain-containing protein [Pseudonocardia sp.]|nr:YbjN domain-containing protein [Pseudonocardia sp.]
MSTDATISAALIELEVEHQRREEGRFLVTMPGTNRLQTHCHLVVSDHALVVTAFVCRRPDEEFEAVYRFLLQRNARLYGVHYTLDRVGDIHLTGRLALHAVTTEEIDRVLGQVLEAADGDFNTLLELGFASSIRREYAWRSDRGESTANLTAFEHLFT